MTLVAELLIEELKERGLNLADATAKFGFEKGELSGIITGRIEMNTKIADKISKGFGTSRELWINLAKGDK
jgi:plasmid maintenance system antidote protein VapI